MIVSKRNFKITVSFLFLVVFELCVSFVECSTPINTTEAARIIFMKCSGKKPVIPCLSGKFADAINDVMDQDVVLFDGFVLKRNNDLIVKNKYRSITSEFSNLRRSLYDFLDSHIVTLELDEGRGKGGYGGFGKVDKKDKKYLYYAMTAVTGIFGLSVPLILKGLALVAAKALLASKAALIIIGSIALKKIFQSDKGSSPVKVHTHSVALDDHDYHDRFLDVSGQQYSQF